MAELMTGNGVGLAVKNAAPQSDGFALNPRLAT
jgi:hypothetical protein